jgi:hypothetical protein
MVKFFARMAEGGIGYGGIMDPSTTEAQSPGTQL